MMNDIINNTKIGVYTHNEESNNFSFSTDLSVAQKLKFVNSVVDLVVDDEHYNSVIRDLVFDFYVIDIMTDIETVDLKESPTFLNDVEEFLFSTNVVEIVKANAFPTLFDELNNAVDKSIEYLTGIHPSPLSDSLTSLVSVIEKKISEVDLSNISNMGEVFEKFAAMTGEFTPENVVNAYMNSNVHKKNLDEISKSKNGKIGKKTKKNKLEVVETEKVDK